MKRTIAALSLGFLLVAGFLFSNGDQTDTAMELEPSIFAVESTF